MRRAAVVVGLLAILAGAGIVLWGHGDDPKPEKARNGSLPELRRTVDGWDDPGAISAASNAESKRVRIAEKLMDLQGGLGPAQRSTVESLLGPPAHTRGSISTYLVQRSRPSDGLGGWCTRSLDINYNKADQVEIFVVGANECPRGLDH